MCFDAVVLRGGLTVALALPTRVTTAAAIVVLVFLIQIWPLDGTIFACLPTAVRLTVVTKLSGVRIQTATRVNKWVSTLLEWMCV